MHKFLAFSVVAPSRMIAQADGSRFGEEDGSLYADSKSSAVGFWILSSIPLNVARRHSGQVNILFADGHVDRRRRGNCFIHRQH